MHSSSRSKLAALSLVLMLTTLWLALHGYHGLTGDGQIYAFQAFARLHPQLNTDLYLQNTSQDQFTAFSPLYAWFIGLMGLENAAKLLTLAITFWLMAATWRFARAVAGRDAAWLAVALLLIIDGSYGASGVFRILDPYLTARLPAEALIITALGCYVRGLRGVGLSLTLVALLIHPLMALSGLLLILCLWLPARISVVGAIGGAIATLALTVVATNLPTAPHLLTVMDPLWLYVVRERSEFLFLQLWSFHDWFINAQPFIYLTFTAITAPGRRTHKLCIAAILVGVTGLTVAFIAGLVGPVAILVQGQAWRWVWLTVFISVVLAPVTTLRVWRDAKFGHLCALLLVAGWFLPGNAGSVCALVALTFWLTRAYLSARLGAHLRWVTAALSATVTAWLLIKGWSLVSTSASPSESTGSVSAQIQDVFALKIPAAIFGLLVWWALRCWRSAWARTLLPATLAALSALIFSAAFSHTRVLATAAEIHEFADWDNVIPATSTVLVAPPRDVGAFVWFTLERPNYLVLNQSAGVVYSRATAMEVRRRSDVLLPLMDPNWNIFTNLHAKSASERDKHAPTRPLTLENLAAVCADPQLGFVISPLNVGFDPVRHVHAGIWQNWYLYDCRRVRSARSAT